MRAHRCDAEALTAAVTERVEAERSYHETLGKRQAAIRRSYLKGRARDVYGLSDALADERENRRREAEKAGQSGTPTTSVDLKAMFAGRGSPRKP